MKKTAFVCRGARDANIPLVYQETPRKDRGDEFLVFFHPGKGDFESLARILFRNVISVSRLGQPLQYFTRVLGMFRNESGSGDIRTDFLSGSMILVMIRRGKNVYILRNRAVETIHWDSGPGIAGPVEKMTGAEELPLVKPEGQGELFEKPVEEFFSLHRFRMPSGTHTLVFVPSGEFAERYRETLLDSIFFPSFESGDDMELDIDRTIPGMHWSSTADGAGSPERFLGKIDAKWKWTAAVGASAALLAAIFLIFNPFGTTEPGLPMGRQVLLSVDEKTPEPEKDPQNTAADPGERIAAESAEAPQNISNTPAAAVPISVKLASEWKKKFNAPVTSSPAISGRNVVFGCRDGYIYSFGMDGTLKWKYAAGDGVGASPWIGNDWIIGADYKGNVFRLDARTGGRTWILGTGEKIISSPRADATMVIAGTTGGRIIAIDASDGRRLWTVVVGKSIWASPTLGEDYIIAAATDGSLSRLSRSGAVQWNSKQDGTIYSSPLVIQNENLVIFGSGDKSVRAVSLADGRLVWRTETGGDMRGSPAFDGTNIYIGSEDGILHALSLDGAKIWNAGIRGAIRSTPLIKDGLLYVTSYGSGLTVLRCADGTPVAEYRAESPVYSSPALDDGLLFFGTMQGFLHAVSISREAV
ncbi:MAG: PQQ-like beta-propeller repeat protein [Candidatus Krumholzibacteria bacterium]|nr:PQQ-like beta-propeller repeat protein [Candidatus Krumholzibacteria bacterium]